jgi:hypothetical protein
MNRSGIRNNFKDLYLHVHVKSLVPKRYIISMFVYLRKMQSMLGIYWKMHYNFFRFWLIKSRWIEQLGSNLAGL